MTGNNASRATNTAVLANHLAEAHLNATQLADLLEVADFLEHEDACAQQRSVLISVALKMADQICSALDTNNLPELR